MDSSEAEEDYVEDFPAHGRRLPPPVREAAGLILAVILLAVVYYHGRIASLGPRVQLFGGFGINFVVLFGVPALVVINKTDINLSRADEIGAFCRKQSIEVVGRIPYDDVVTEAMVHGLPVTAFEDGVVSAELKHVWQRVRDWLTR